MLIHKNLVVSYYYVNEGVLINLANSTNKNEFKYYNYYGSWNITNYQQDIFNNLDKIYTQNYDMKKSLELSNSKLDLSFYKKVFIDKINTYLIQNNIIKQAYALEKLKYF